MIGNLMGWLAVVITLFVAAILLGLAGRRWRSMRLSLAVLGPLYAAAVLIYSLVEGSTSTCTGTGGTFQCVEQTYASTWGVGGSMAVALVMILTLAPLASAWLRNRIPSLVAAIALPVVIGSFAVELVAWVPVWAAVLAAAIAGPPSRDRETKEPAPRV